MVKVLSVKRVDSCATICDVTVTDNHNLYVCDKINDVAVLVHNCLDENGKYLGGQPFNTPMGGLEQIFMYYGNDYYKTAPFGKGDRANPNLTKLDNPDFIKYGVLDVQSIFGIHQMQIKQSGFLEIEGKNFTPFYKRLVLKQFSNTVHVLSHMKQRGSTVDKKYLELLKGPDSPLKELIKKTTKELLEMESVKKANKILIKEASGQKSNKGLFGKVQSVFGFNKAEHKKTLFFNVLGLAPVSWSKKTKNPAIDKKFVEAYKGTNDTVKKFGEYQKLTKLYGTYVKGWWRVLSQNVDSVADFRLRPDYGFFAVVTGRLNSSRPSLQQVPAHGDVAKYIKRMFIALPGHLLVKFDYSAHEIRCWSYVSGDWVLAGVFKIGQRLRQLFRIKPSEDKATELKTKGDLHIINCFHFFGRWIQKSDPLRDAVKKIVFGVIYGKSVKSLASDLRNERVLTLSGKISTLERGEQTKETIAELKSIRKELKTEEEKDWEEYSAEIIAKLYEKFPKAAKWLQWSMNHAEEHLYTFSPIGMRRNLFGIMTGINSIVAAMRRRAANSPIQGLASQIGVTAARLIELELYDVLTRFGYMDENSTDLPSDITKAIHDALHAESPYNILIILKHVISWTSTYGVTEYYDKEFGLKFTVPPEIEMEFGASEDKMFKWDWSTEQFDKIVKDSLVDQQKLGFCDNTDKAYEEIMSVKKNKKLVAYLEAEYPILGLDMNRRKIINKVNIKETT